MYTPCVPDFIVEYIKNNSTKLFLAENSLQLWP